MVKTGIIRKGIGGFYYVDAADAIFDKKEDAFLYECKARGIFRNQNITPLVGDIVDIEIQDTEKHLATIVKIHKRKNSLIRPASANIDQAILIFSVKQPAPNEVLVDSFLINMEEQGTEVLLCISKTDLDPEKTEVDHLKVIYKKAGYTVIPICTKTGDGIIELKEKIRGKTSVLSGPSGVGKSSLVNILSDTIHAEVGNISEKIGRGKNTTRQTELLDLPEFAEKTRIMDTPGFSSVDILCHDEKDLQYDFREFKPFNQTCRFTGCVHMKEPGCNIKKAVEDGIISEERYISYKKMYESLKNKRKW